MRDPDPAPRHIWLTVGQFAATLAIVLLTKIVAAEAFYVPSGSMQPTLLIGDELAVSKFPYGYSRYSLPIAIGPALPQRLLGRLPARGDVVVFRLPRDPSQTYVKRVVGLPGDRVQMRNGRLWINGQELPLRRDGFGEVRMRAAAPYGPPAISRHCPAVASTRCSSSPATASSTIQTFST